MANLGMENEILGLEKKYWDAMKAGDKEVMLELTDENCIVANSNGVVKFRREDFSKMLDASNYKIKDFRFDKHEVSVLNDETAVIAYKIWEDLEVDGKPVEMEATESSTWIKKDGKWVCSLHTESIAGDPFGRDRSH